ncbi:MAG: hypothetical protein JSS96_15085 [Bacteroidetes bacterium]|nr:hypothetical protein [Bacteroidota bacterium]
MGTAVAGEVLEPLIFGEELTPAVDATYVKPPYAPEPIVELTGTTKVQTPTTKQIGPAGDADASVTKQVPDNWEKKTTKKGDGTLFKDPKNPQGNNFRVQRGNPKSPNPGQQKPYVKETKNGKVIDAKGNEVKPDSKEAHTPKADYKYDKSN